MSKIDQVSIGAWRSDRTQAFYDGRVGLPGRNVIMVNKPLEEIFSIAFSSASYEVTELSFSNFLRMRTDGDCAYLGIPVFPSRAFRHGAFYVRKNGDIKKPEDLVGRKVGVREYSMTAALAARGALRDQFGVQANQIKWVMGDPNERERDHIVLPMLYRDISIEVAPNGAFLDDMLLAGEIDAILAYKPINSAFGPDAVSCRLFEDVQAIEADYFMHSGVFPIMHLIGVRTKDAKIDPSLIGDVYQAFDQAQKLANQDLAYEQALKISLPWVRNEFERTQQIMGENYWPSGLTANRKVLETMISWSFEDGMISRKPEPEELFFDAMHAI